MADLRWVMGTSRWELEVDGGLFIAAEVWRERNYVGVDTSPWCFRVCPAWKIERAASEEEAKALAVAYYRMNQ